MSANTLPDKLVSTANRIGRFFSSQGGEAAGAETADHICSSCDPRMRGVILAHLAAGGAGLDATARRAIERLERERGHPLR